MSEETIKFRIGFNYIEISKKNYIEHMEKLQKGICMKRILIDFDGVIHSYKSKWERADIIPDPPVEGAIPFLVKLVASEKFQPLIYSSRSKSTAGIEAMKVWLEKHGMARQIINKIQFPTQKPAAFLTIDDRCICFEGTFPELNQIENFTPWNKRSRNTK